jgi:hypothetical protein
VLNRVTYLNRSLLCLELTREGDPEGMKKSTIVMLVVAVILVITCTCSFALVDQEQIQVLRGLERVHVVIKRLKPEIELDGLYRSTLETDVELTLRMAGIKVLSEGEALQTSGVPDLCLKVNVLKCSSGYVYNIGLSLEEKVTLSRRSIQISATTLRIWEQLGIAHRLSDIRDSVRDLLEEFVKGWQAANQK